jgi:hypothetical protein
MKNLLKSKISIMPWRLISLKTWNFQIKVLNYFWSIRTIKLVLAISKQMATMIHSNSVLFMVLVEVFLRLPSIIKSLLKVKCTITKNLNSLTKISIHTDLTSLWVIKVKKWVFSFYQRKTSIKSHSSQMELLTSKEDLLRKLIMV